MLACRTLCADTAVCVGSRCFSTVAPVTLLCPACLTFWASDVGCLSSQPYSTLAVASLGVVGELRGADLTAPGDTIQKSDTIIKLLFCGWIYKKNTGQTTLERGEGGSGDQTWQTMTQKGRHFLKEKNRVTPSVAAPGDTNLSDATD